MKSIPKPELKSTKYFVIGALIIVVSVLCIAWDFVTTTSPLWMRLVGGFFSGWALLNGVFIIFRARKMKAMERELAMLVTMMNEEMAKHPPHREVKDEYVKEWTKPKDRENLN